MGKARGRRPDGTFYVAQSKERSDGIETHHHCIDIAISFVRPCLTHSIEDRSIGDGIAITHTTSLITTSS